MMTQRILIMIKNPLEGGDEKQSGYFINMKHRSDLPSRMQGEATRNTTWHFHLIMKSMQSFSRCNLYKCHHNGQYVSMCHATSCGMY